MQVKKIAPVKFIMDALKKHYGFKTYGLLADFLGVKQNTLSSWIARGSFDIDLVYRKCEGINFKWLETGEGEMFLKPPPPEPGLTDAAENERIVHDMLKRVYGWDAGEVITSLTALPRSARMKILAQMFEAIEEEDKKKREEE
jgi:hypothetical protein